MTDMKMTNVRRIRKIKVFKEKMKSLIMERIARINKDQSMETT